MQSSQVTIASFYSFTAIDNPEILLPKLLLIGKKKMLRGTCLIATEGVNGSISGSKEAVLFFIDEMKKLINPSEFILKLNYCDTQPFQKLKVKIKKEIIKLNVGDLNIQNSRGFYVEPKDWDRFVKDENVIMIDTRNNYEVEVGTFKGAINPNTENFTDFPNWVSNNLEKLQNKKIAMYCTGGVRCEKSTAYLKKLGFNDVYHLKGGILQYFEDTNNANNLWVGDGCFVFDDRRVVNTDLSPTEGYFLQRNLNS